MVCVMKTKERNPPINVIRFTRNMNSFECMHEVQKYSKRYHVFPLHCWSPPQKTVVIVTAKPLKHGNDIKSSACHDQLLTNIVRWVLFGASETLILTDPEQSTVTGLWWDLVYCDFFVALTPCCCQSLAVGALRHTDSGDGRGATWLTKILTSKHDRWPRFYDC